MTDRKDPPDEPTPIASPADEEDVIVPASGEEGLIASASGEEGLIASASGEEGLITSAPASRVGGRRAAPAWSRRRWLQVLTALLLAAGLTAGSVYWWVYRPDRLTDTAARDRVLDAAREATEALLSYSPESIDTDVTDAKSRLTGDFLERYSEFADTVVAPAAKERGIKTEANVARAAVSEIRPGQAQVLVFVNQVTTSKERPTPALATSSVMVTLVDSGGRWLISDFQPI